jgi:hypothetical protein
MLRRGVLFLFGVLVVLPFQIPLDFGVHYRLFLGSVLAVPLISLYLLLTRDTNTPRKRFDIISEMIFVFIGFSILCVFLGILRYPGLSGIASFAYQAYLISYFFLGLLLLRNPEDLWSFSRGVCFTCLLICIAIMKDFYHTRIHSDVFLAHKLFITPYEGDISWVLRTDFVAGWPTAFGVFLNFTLMLSVILFKASHKRISKILYFGMGFIFFINIVFTFSRTAYIVCVLSILVLVFMIESHKVRLLFIISSTFGILLVLSMLPDIVHIISYFGSFHWRLKILDFMVDKSEWFDLIFGHGYHSFTVITEKYASETVLGVPISELSSHNEYLKVYLKSGLFGVAILIFILYQVLKRTIRLGGDGFDDNVRSFFRIWFCALGPFYLSLFVFEGLHYWPTGVVFWFVSGSMTNFLIRRSPSVA